MLVAALTMALIGPPVSHAQGPAQPSSDNTASMSEFLGNTTPGCSGPACGDVALKVEAGCVWASNKNSRPVAMSVNLAGGSIQVALEGADAAKAGPASSVTHSPGASGESKQCEDARKEKKVLDETGNADLMPNLARILANCPEPKPVNLAASNGYMELAYDPVFGRNYPLYRGKLATTSGCVPQLQDVRSYIANYR